VWTLIAGVVMVVGVAGVIVPGLPGLLLVVAAGVGYGFAVGFSPLGWVVIGVLGVLLAISIALGVMIPQREAARAGTAGISQWAALLGAIIGFFVIPVFGLIAGAIIGALVAEYQVKGNWDEAWTATLGLVKGLGISMLVDLVIGVVMIAAWSVWALTVLF